MSTSKQLVIDIDAHAVADKLRVVAVDVIEAAFSGAGGPSSHWGRETGIRATVEREVKSAVLARLKSAQFAALVENAMDECAKDAVRAAVETEVAKVVRKALRGREEDIARLVSAQLEMAT